ncbi:MAG: DNA protecting protein DprA [Gammaproteobacteria bacterium 39-13]|nr:DNA-processing protein DprA [Gammaproteobacteria bacterium]OJV90729.1 MAG: DNA protecting protein DprA [Gammaproteobacteria bacterium 39-13]
MQGSRFQIQAKNEDEIASWLAVRRCPGIGPRKFAALLEQTKSLSDCFSGGALRPDFDKWCKHHGISAFVPDWKGVESDLKWSEEEQNHIVTINDQAYPELLRQIETAPPILFVCGKINALHYRQLAIVGSRHPSALGRENAYHFASVLSQHGWAITSGLALGIDACSHEGTLAALGITIAVLGSGLNQIYPAKHKALAQQITEKGALVSEFPIGTPPLPSNFPQRNRLISGLSWGVLVVESALKSGSLITANYALDQGREVFALPGSIHNPMARGCHQLIRQGAKCVESIEHIMEEFPMLATKGCETKQQDFASAIRSKPKKELRPSTSLPLLAHVSEVCTPIDLIVDRSGLTVEEVSSILLELELQGVVACVPGGYIRIGTGG